MESQQIHPSEKAWGQVNEQTNKQSAMPSDAASFATRLNQGPSYLLLGQRWLVDSVNDDPFLRQVLKKLAAEGHTTALNYSALLTAAVGSDSGILEWMAGRCPNISLPEKIELIARFPWNGVFTSAIDDVLSPHLRNPTRDVQRVMSMDYQPADPRSRSKLNVWYLYGNVAAPDDLGKPPLTRLSLIRRQQVATQMAASLPELVTPLGTLCVEGFDPENDWLNAEQFFAIVSSFAAGQVHWFSGSDSLAEHALIRPLVESGQLTIHRESLAHLFSKSGIDTGTFDYLDFDKESLARRIRIAKRIVSIPADIFRQVQATGSIVPEEAFSPKGKLSLEENYANFRRFLYESGHHPVWEAYGRGYAFRRDFQSPLERAVRAQLSSPAQRGRGEPVIVHGASGSGKSVAFAQLAFDIQKEGVFPVLFIEHGTRIRNETIDRFCLWAEDNGAQSVAIIWDGMLSPREYLDLHSLLNSRGRKFVLVGSSYQTDINFHKASNSVPVERVMNRSEASRFTAFLQESQFSELIQYLRPSTEETFLGQLYRALPTTRFPLQVGLGREVAHASELLRRKRISTAAPAGAFGTNLGDVFDQIGIPLSSNLLGDKREIVAGEEVDDIQQLIGLIMVPGQYGHACPFELLMRTISRDASGNLVEILRSIDIFQVREDSNGNPVVGPRTSLEAQLIVRRLIGGARAEVEYLARLLRNVRSSYITGSREVDFAVDVLRSVGPNGAKEQYYRPYFPQIADCLRELRQERGVRHVRLLLQESTYLREAAKIAEGADAQAASTPAKRAHLEQALGACREALQQLADQRANRFMRSRLLVEMASTWGTLTKGEPSASERLRFVNEAHAAAWEAFKVDSGNHFALDVVAWTARDALNAGGLAPEQRVRIVESVTHAFALAESEEWDAEAEIQLDRRRVELRDLVFGSKVSEDAFNNLLQLGSAAGIVVKAWQISETTSDNPEERKRAARAGFEWMDQAKHRSVVEGDPRAAFLRFRLWWVSKLGFDFNERERIALPFSGAEWDQCHRVVGQLLTSDQFHEHPTLRLIEAVSFFQRGEYSRGFGAFEALNADLPFARHRVIRRFVFADERGRARIFSGTIVRLEGRDGALQLSGFSRWIPFFAHEAGRPDLRRGDDLSGFAIAFNMLGPIAEFRTTSPAM